MLQDFNTLFCVNFNIYTHASSYVSLNSHRNVVVIINRFT